MNNNIIREIDFQGRLNPKADLLELSQISKYDKIAICQHDEGKIVICRLEDVWSKGYKVIATSKVDEKGRILIPSEIREQTKKVNIYFFNGDLILEEAL